MNSAKQFQYRAAYWFRNDRVDARLLDFPEVCVSEIDQNTARLALQEALWDVLEEYAALARPFPIPNPDAIDQTADVVEPLTWIDSSTFPGFIEISDTVND